MEYIDDNGPYERLANAIVLQAVKDYRKAGTKLARGRKPKDAAIMKEDCLRFFRSEWFQTLTGIEPEYLIRKLDEEVDNDDSKGVSWPGISFGAENKDAS